MKKSWTTTKLITAGSLGVLSLVLALAGAGLAGVTGITGASGFINVFVCGMLFAVCCLVIRKFGAATIMSFIYSVMAIPLPLYGTPGFLPKIATGLLVGLVVDTVYLALKRNDRVAALGTGGASQLAILVVVVQLGRLFGMPGIAQAAKLFWSPLLVIGSILFGTIAGYLGWLIYQKIKGTAVVRRIQG